MKFKVLVLGFWIVIYTFSLEGQVRPDEQLPINFPVPITSFPGGEDSLEVFLSNNLKWPSPDFCGQGRVFIGFTVEKNGEISNVRVRKSLCTACDEEAIRVVCLMPNWVPAVKNGHAIEMEVVLPIVFKLE